MRLAATTVETIFYGMLSWVVMACSARRGGRLALWIATGIMLMLPTGLLINGLVTLAAGRSDDYNFYFSVQAYWGLGAVYVAHVVAGREVSSPD